MVFKTTLMIADQRDGDVVGKALKNPVDDIIIKTLETVRSVIKDGIPSSNIPPLDPFVIEQLQVETNSSVAQ